MMSNLKMKDLDQGEEMCNSMMKGSEQREMLNYMMKRLTYNLIIMKMNMKRMRK